MSSTTERFGLSADLAHISQITDLNNLDLTKTTETPILETSAISTSQPVAQWVYIQAPPKMSSGISMPSNQSVILQPVSNNKPSHLILQKPTNIQTYITMIKQQPQIGAAPPSTPQNQKFVIAPMPKLTSNRLPQTLTTNSVQSKIALMPVTSKLLNIQVNENQNNCIKIDEDKLVCDEIITVDDCSDTDNDKSKPNQKITHGVSILKKNFNIIEKNLISEVKIATSQNHQKSTNERRRKSNVSYRKDYDDEIVVTSNNVQESRKRKLSSDDDVVEIKMIHKKKEVVEESVSDLKSALSWEKGLALLPGTDIKFHMNEFGFIEYLKKEEPKLKLETEMRCIECGCYGSSSEFINPKFCSNDCQANNSNKVRREPKAKRKRSFKKMEDEPGSPGDEGSTSNENSQDRITSNPWICKKKGFSWSKYLEHVKAKAVPVKFFKDPFPYNRNGFRPGMKLEGVDPLHPKYFCVLTVMEVSGYRIRLHFDGYSENYDFWANADSMDIFPAGWCEKHGHDLLPPPGYTAGNFSLNNYLKEIKGVLAPKHLFANRAGSAICPNGFRIGMKLEAVDRKNTTLVCVATIVDMMDNRILVHFDSWDDIYDYWADPTSPYIHPVGWCDQNGHNLTPPNKYPNPESFTWEKYLKETKSVAAPVRAFKQRPSYAFKKGMRLECVDRKIPQFIRVATIQEVKEHQLLIKFDGWRDRYNCWYDTDSPDIHPVGWCQKTGHPIEPPLTPEDIYDFLECPTVGCRGYGNIKGFQFANHSTVKECPYADENMSLERTLPDRLLSPDRQLEAVVPVSREPKEGKVKQKVGRPPKVVQKLEPEVKPDPVEEEIEEIKPLKRKSPEPSLEEDNFMKSECKEEPFPLTNGYDGAYTEQIWDKHSKCLKSCIKRQKKSPRLWTVEEVVQYVNTLPYIRHHSALFKQNKIDGEAFLTLNQRDLIDILKIKLGPAIKLYSVIVLLRRIVFS